MKKLVTILLSILMVVSLTACGGGISEDANKYTAYSISMLGFEMEPSEIYEDDIVLALDEKGNAKLSLDGTDYNCKWKMDGDIFTLSQGSDEFTGTKEGDVVTIVNLLYMDLDISFLKDGADLPVDTSKPMGKYLISGMDIYGMEMTYADIQDAEMELYLDFKEDGTVELCSYGDVTELQIDYDAKTIEFDGAIGEFVFEDDQFIMISEEDDTTMEMYFTAEDSEKWEEIKAEQSTITDGFADSGFIAPGYGAEKTVPVEELSLPSDWYGVIRIVDYEGPYDDMEGEHEAWATLSNDAKGDFFEIDVEDIYEDGGTVLTYSAEVYEYTFFPIIDEDAWIFDSQLVEEDGVWFTPSIIDGVLTANYYYEDDDESFTFFYELAMIEGTDEETSTDVETSTDSVDIYNLNTQNEQTVDFTLDELIALVDSFDYTLKTYDDLIAHFGGHPYLDWAGETTGYYRYRPNDDTYKYVEFGIENRDGKIMVVSQKSELKDWNA